MCIKKTKNKIAIFLGGLFFGFLVLFQIASPAKAEIVYDPTHTNITIAKGVVEQAFGKLNEYANTFSASIASKSWIDYLYEKTLLPILKQMAIQKVNDMTTAVITEGNAGKPYLVTDWNQYLVKGPADDAMVYVNSLLDNSARGRASKDYSNSGYYSYIDKQARSYINPQPVDITMVHANGDFQENMFSGGDLRAFNEFLTPGKNPYSYTLIAADALEKKTAENQLIAEKEAVNGYLPMKDGVGKITTPAAVFENSFNSASNMGREMVVNATKTDELLGAVVNFVVQSAMKPLKSGLLSVSSSGGVQQITAGVNMTNSGINVLNKAP